MRALGGKAYFESLGRMETSCKIPYYRGSQYRRENWPAWARDAYEHGRRSQIQVEYPVNIKPAARRRWLKRNGLVDQPGVNES